MNLPLRPLFVSIAAPLLFAGVCACSTASAGTAGATPSAPSTPDAALRAFAKAIGVTCDDRDGRLACIGGKPEVGDYYDVDLHPGCGNDGLLGGVIAQGGTSLRDRIAPLDRRTTARLAMGQLFCIEAIGWAGKHASYYYVRQIPAHSVAVCTGNIACNGFGDRPVQVTGKPHGPCTITSNGQPSNACAAGWMRGDDAALISGRK